MGRQVEYVSELVILEASWFCAQLGFTFHVLTVVPVLSLVSSYDSQNGGHCQPKLYGYPPDVAAFQVQNYHAVKSLIKKYDIDCEYEEMEGGGCHAYFSPRHFEDALEQVADLLRCNPAAEDSITIATGKPALENLKVSHAVGAIVQKHAAKLSPYKLVSWILETLIKGFKLNLQTNTPVLDISRPNPSYTEWSVNTPRGTILTSHVHLAINAYTSRLSPQFSELIIPVRGQMSALSSPTLLLDRPLKHTYSFIGTMQQAKIQDDYLIQRPVTEAKADGQLMFGGGRLLATHQGVGLDNDDKIDEPVALYLRTTLPDFLDLDEKYANAEISNATAAEQVLVAEMEWTGAMGFSCDEYPWVGAIPNMSGLWISAGFTGHGILFSSIRST